MHLPPPPPPFSLQPTIDDKIQLGPRAQINWVKGSSGGAGAKANESGEDKPLALTLSTVSTPSSHRPVP